MADLDSICYKKNFVTAVILRVDFSPILNLADRIPSFQANLRERFPVLEIKDGVTYSTQIDKTGIKSENSTNFKIWHFLDASKKNKIIFAPDHLVFECTGYSTFDALYAEAQVILAEAQKATSSFFVTRFGLRYINEIQISDGSAFEWNGYINKNLYSDLEFYGPELSNMARLLKQAFINYEDFTMIFTYGLHNPEFPGKIAKKVFLLDYDCYTPSIEFSDIPKVLRTYHTAIQEKFEASIDVELRNLMEKK